MSQYIGQDLGELIKHQAKSQDESGTFTKTGLISYVDATTYMAKVVLMPEGIETGFLPLSSMAIGPGWGIFHVPPINAECSVQFTDGSIDNGRIVGFHANAIDAPPAGLEQGEFLLQHKSGSLLHFGNDGSVNIVTSKGLTATVGGDVTLTAQGDVSAVVSGDVTVGTAGDVTVTSAGSITAAAVGKIDCTALVEANLSAAVVNVTALTAANVVAPIINLTGLVNMGL